MNVSVDEFGLPNDVMNLLSVISQRGKVYIVGGIVRDFLMKRNGKKHDIDLVSNLSIAELGSFLKEKGFHISETGIDFGVITANLESGNVDIATFRAETYKRDSRKPIVNYVKTIEEDLARRDFTINAIALEYMGDYFKVIDPFGGLSDISKKIIRAVGNPDARFDEDPLRIMRACRFGTLSGFTIDRATQESMRRLA
jgi:tRNA nucleotidyltransferase/poly(A) polymerase